MSGRGKAALDLSSKMHKSAKNPIFKVNKIFPPSKKGKMPQNLKLAPQKMVEEKTLEQEEDKIL